MQLIKWPCYVYMFNLLCLPVLMS